MRLGLFVVVLLTACGRLHFGSVGDGSGPGGDGAVGDGTGGPTGDGGGSACVQSSYLLSQSALRSWTPAVAWNGTAAGIVWVQDPTNANTAIFRTVTPTGTLGQLATLENLGSGEAPDIDGDGTAFRIGIAANGASAHRQVHRSTDGAAPIAVTATGKDNVHARVAAVGGGSVAYVAGESAGTSIWNALYWVVDSTGTTTVAGVTAASGLFEPQLLDLVWTGTEVALFFYVGSTSSGQIEMQRMNVGGTAIGAPIPIATVAGPPASLTASWAQDRHLVTWVLGNGASVVYVASDGTLLHPVRSVAIGSSLSTGITSAIGASSDLVLWSDLGNDASYIVPVSRDGTLGAVQTLAMTSAIGGVWTGSGWLIAAARGMGGSEQMFAVALCP